MKPMTLKSCKILNLITDGLHAPGDAKRIDNASPTYMKLSVDRTDTRTYALAHNFIQNGDVMADPDVEFLKGADGLWYPMAIQQDPVGKYTRAIVSVKGGMPEQYSPRQYEDLRSFCEMWLKNIVDQQGLTGWEDERFHPRNHTDAGTATAEGDAS